MEMTTVKTIVVLAIIFGCFAVLYPKIFHPMLMHAFGIGEKVERDSMENMGPGSLPPHLRRPGPKMAHHVQQGEEFVSRQMKAGPHPGMRAAAEMKKQAAQQGGPGGKGMMSVVLPMYAVGIVIYLIYTMTKVFGRQNKKDDGRDYLSTHFSDIQYNAEKQKFSRRGIPDSDDEEDEMLGPRRHGKKKRRDLERLLMKADRDKISESEVAELKRRLLETEEQMTRILQAMETVTQQVDTAAENVTQAPQQQESPESENVVDDDTVYVKSVASSPDTESYEFLNNQTPDSEDLKNLPMDEKEVENIGPEPIDETEEAEEQFINEDGEDADGEDEQEDSDKEIEGIEESSQGDFQMDSDPKDLRKRLPRSAEDKPSED